MGSSKRCVNILHSALCMFDDFELFYFLVHIMDAIFDNAPRAHNSLFCHVANNKQCLRIHYHQHIITGFLFWVIW